MNLRGAPDPAARKEAEFANADRWDQARDRAVAAKVEALRCMTVGDLLGVFGNIRVTLGEVAHIEHPAERARGIILDLAAVIEALAERCIDRERAAYLAFDEYDDDRR